MSDKKNLGQYFTPQHVAEFMIDLSGANKTSKILEPSCGNGVFLSELERKGFKNVIGYEIDRSLISKSRLPVKYASFISEATSDDYDLVIGNPPYIRWKNLDQELKTELETNSLWTTYFTSMSDYLCIFVLKSVEALKEGGELIFITPEYWMNTKHAEPLREYLVGHGYFSDIVHFKETPIFENVSSSILIFRYVKSTTASYRDNKIRIIKYSSVKKLTKSDLSDIKNGKVVKYIQRFLRPQFSSNQRWLLVDEEVEDRLNLYERQCSLTHKPSLLDIYPVYSTLGDIADIGNGMVSGLDKAFKIPPDMILTKEESQSTLSVLKAKNIVQYTNSGFDRYIFLNNQVLNEKDLKKNFPNFYLMLHPFREDLEKRYNYNRNIPYWEWAFLRSYSLFDRKEPRIFVPCKERISHKSYFRFTYVNKGIFPTQDVTAIFRKPGVRESLHFLIALLNSKYVFDWLSNKGVVKGSIVEFSEKPLASIPIRLIDWENAEEVRIHNKISDLCSRFIETGDPAALQAIDEVLLPRLLFGDPVRQDVITDHLSRPSFGLVAEQF